MKQAAAAVGQCSMMFLYDKFFNDYDKTIAQILLNAEDMEPVSYTHLDVYKRQM